jgi:iron complex outermembrane receptor protein
MPPLEFNFEPEFKKQQIGKLTQLFLKPGFQYLFAQNLVDINEKTTPAVLLINADLGFKILEEKKLGKIEFPQGVQISLGLRNIFNTPYLKHLSRYRLLNIPEPGFNLMLTLRTVVGN